MNNNKVGSIFEKDFSNYLSKKSFWVHFIEKTIYGSQPFDVIAIKNNLPYCFDCKTLNNNNGLFNINRIEENQRLAFKKYIKCRNSNFSLAILWNNNIYIVPFIDIDFDKKSIDLKKRKPNIENFSKEIDNAK